VGEDVEMEIDGALRVLHARVHSAGHALDVAVLRCGFGPETLEPTKGSHGTDVAYVEYKGKIDPGHELADVEKFKAALNDEMAKIIRENGLSFAAEMEFEDAKSACGGCLPSFVTEDMRPRVVVIVPNTPGCPCGGTHVASMSELIGFKVTGVRTKKGVTRLSYAIPGMASWDDGPS
jgi:Ser-tRNA(Ala) deacylase AlaX